MSHTKLILSKKRFNGHLNEHKHITDPQKMKRFCEMCCFKAANNCIANKKRKVKGRAELQVHKIVETRKISNFCDVHLCDKCFDAYHKWSGNL